MELETIDHFLLHCVKARLFWQLVFSIFGVWWVIYETVRETLLGWNVTFIEKRRIKAWRAAPTCIFWTLWKERNRRFFDGEKLLDQRLKSLFLNNFSMWFRHHTRMKISVITDILVLRFYGYIGDISRIFWKKKSISLKLIKIYKNIRKI